MKILEQREMVVLVGMIILATLLIALHGVHLGIEFVGGVRIPVTLEKPVDQPTMDSVVNILKTRIDKMGLQHSLVYASGNERVIVEIPNEGPGAVQTIKKLLASEGKFEAIIDGKQALNGAGIISVGGAQSERIYALEKGGVGYSLGFAVDQASSQMFSEAARGKAQYPVFMFLDRPSKAIIVMHRSWVGNGADVQAIKEALKKEGDDIELVWDDEIDKVNITNKKIAIVAKEENQSVKNKLGAFGLDLKEKTLEEMKPQFRVYEGIPHLNKWKAIGLLSAPSLSPSLANGFVSQFYEVTGSGEGKTAAEQKKSAEEELRMLKSLISGGKMPVNTIVESSYAVPPSLGKEFLNLSLIGALFAALAVISIIFIRYKKAIIILPILFTLFVEFYINISILGTIGTIDLGAMAGIIAAVGTGVDDQIIITEEVLNKREERIKEKISRAFYIVLTTALASIITLVPLLLVGIVEVIGFATATIVGVLIGVLVTRPAYGFIIRKIFERKGF